MARRPTGDKPLSEPMIVLFIEYMHRLCEFIHGDRFNSQKGRLIVTSRQVSNQPDRVLKCLNRFQILQVGPAAELPKRLASLERLEN